MTVQAFIFIEPISYDQATDWQTRLQSARIRNEIPDTVLFVEHPPSVTLGRRGRANFLKWPAEEYARHGVALCQSSRGGDVTFHAPGQLVIYPIMRLGECEADAHGYLHNLEEIALRTAADFGVTGFRRAGKNGIWTERGKLAAIGFQLRHWVTSHGMSFNVNMDLSGFSSIVPCGLVGEPVTSLQAILGEACPPLALVRERTAQHFADVCSRPFQYIRVYHADELEILLAEQMDKTS